MSIFNTFMMFTLLEDIFRGLKELATSPDTAKCFWAFAAGLIIVLSVALFIVTHVC